MKRLKAAIQEERDLETAYHFDPDNQPDDLDDLFGESTTWYHAFVIGTFIAAAGALKFVLDRLVR